MTIKTLAIIIKLEDNNIYQVLLSKSEAQIIELMLSIMHNEKIKVIDKKIDGVYIGEEDHTNQ